MCAPPTRLVFSKHSGTLQQHKLRYAVDYWNRLSIVPSFHLIFAFIDLFACHRSRHGLTVCRWLCAAIIYLPLKWSQHRSLVFSCDRKGETRKKMQQTTFDRPTFDRMPLLLLLLYDHGSGIHLFMNPVLTSTLMIEPSLCPPLCKFSYFISPPCRLFNLSVLAHSLNADDDDVLIFDRSDCITDSLYIHTSTQKFNSGSSRRGGS